MKDTISRQDAVDCEYQVKIINDIEYVMLSEVQMKMRKLPPVQPESLTDAEQRIFLKAISREKEVCKRIDQDWSSTPFVDGVEPLNLADVCDEIKRKVKGALWP